MIMYKTYHWSYGRWGVGVVGADEENGFIYTTAHHSTHKHIQITQRYNREIGDDYE